MKKITENWISMAENDLRAAEIIIKDDNPLTNIVVFHCQQAIEKYLKAFLVENDIPLAKTHDLVRLNEMVQKNKNLDIDENMFDIINEVYVESRYPTEFGLMSDATPTHKQAMEFIEYVKEVKIVINNELSSN